MSAEPPRPKVSDELLELFASGVALYVATCSEERVPESQPGMGIRVHPDRRHVTVYVPTATAAATLSNLRATGQVAATLCHPPDHRTVQLKGLCTGVRDSTDVDREVQEVFRAALVGTFATIGVPRAMTRSLPWWPSTAIEFELRDVYTQTPGPNAGERLGD
jgi:hypothetical protein